MSTTEELGSVSEELAGDNKGGVRTRGTVPGKVFVIPFAVILLFLLWLVFSMAVRFQAIMRQLEKSRAAWPAVAQQLKARYESIDKAAAELPPEIQKPFAEQKLLFDSSTQFDLQVGHVLEMEQLLGRGSVAKQLPSELSNVDTEEIRKLASLEEQRANLQNGFVGGCTMGGLRLRLPPFFRLPNASR